MCLCFCQLSSSINFLLIEFLLLYDYYYDFYELFGTVILFLYPHKLTCLHIYRSMLDYCGIISFKLVSYNDLLQCKSVILLLLILEFLDIKYHQKFQVSVYKVSVTHVFTYIHPQIFVGICVFIFSKGFYKHISLSMQCIKDCINFYLLYSISSILGLTL